MDNPSRGTSNATWSRPKGFAFEYFAMAGRDEGEVRCPWLPCHPVPRIQSGDLVGFRQRRIVERVLDEVVDRAFEVEHGLADMDQLGGAFAEDVHAEQAAGLGR